MLTREHDAIIAEKLFGYHPVPQPPDVDGLYGGELVLYPPGRSPLAYVWPPKGKVEFYFFVPHFRKTLSDALSIVKQLYLRGHWPVSLMLREYESHLPIWECEIMALDGRTYVAAHEALPDAICLATLKVLESTTGTVTR